MQEKFYPKNKVIFGVFRHTLATLMSVKPYSQQFAEKTLDVVISL